MEFRFEKGKALALKNNLSETEMGTQLCNHESCHLLEVTNTQKIIPGIQKIVLLGHNRRTLKVTRS